MLFFVIIFHYSFYKHGCLTPCLFLAAGLLPPNYYKAGWNTYCRRMGEPKGDEWNTSKFTVTLECLPSEFNQATAWEQRSTCVSHDAHLLHKETPRMAAGNMLFCRARLTCMAQKSWKANLLKTDLSKVSLKRREPNGGDAGSPGVGLVMRNISVHKSTLHKINPMCGFRCLNLYPHTMHSGL